MCLNGCFARACPHSKGSHDVLRAFPHVLDEEVDVVRDHLGGAPDMSRLRCFLIAQGMGREKD